MKNYLFFTLFIFPCLLSAQHPPVYQESKFYSRLHLGYSFVSGGGQNDQEVQGSNGSYVISLTPFSYGKGLNLGYGLGYMITPNFGVEVGASYLFGGRGSEKNVYHEDSVAYPFIDEQEFTYKVNLLRINPSFIVSAKVGKVTPYAKFGFMAGLGKGINESTDNIKYKNMPASSASSGFFKWELAGARAMGFTSALGIIFSDEGESKSFFVEVSNINMSGTFKNSKMTTATIDDTDVLSSLDVYDTEAIFVDEIDESEPISFDEPRKILKQKASFDSFGINIGLIIKIGGW